MSISNTFGAEQNCLSVYLPSTFYCMYIIEVEKGKSCLGINPYKAMHLWNGVYLVDCHLPRYGLNIPRRLSGPATTSLLAEATIRENNHHLLVHVCFGHGLEHTTSLPSAPGRSVWGNKWWQFDAKKWRISAVKKYAPNPQGHCIVEQIGFEFLLYHLPCDLNFPHLKRG